eukprot:CAMPEP_0170484556 /NCGR_PEP_ID=MMETSP0208-20121228/3983_1 /TAXON_ID=197538 /ORGANISM="Strombidium inclinatum, Strain S3" /LENGTH=42 /DNA_ID= /DNA_START= /DNA_END= /DNA_ORIENTATION=
MAEERSLLDRKAILLIFRIKAHLSSQLDPRPLAHEFILEGFE